MDKFSEEFNRLLKDPHNKICFDCGASLPKWASVNNSVYLCLNCAGVHRGLGVNISFIRSITMDNWDPKQIKLMSIGGNKRLKKLMKEFGIPADTETGKKYKLKALEYHRKMLRAEAFNEEIPEKPDNLSAFEEIETFKQGTEINNNNFISCQGSNYQESPKEENNFFNSVGTFFENKVSNLQNGIKEMKIKEKTGDFSKKAVDYMGEKTTEIMNSYFVQSIFKKSKQFFGGNANESEQKPESEINQKTNDVNPVDLLGNNTVSNSQNEVSNVQPRQNNPNSDQNIYDFFTPPTKSNPNEEQKKDDLFNELFSNNNTNNNTSSTTKANDTNTNPSSNQNMLLDF